MKAFTATRNPSKRQVAQEKHHSEWNIKASLVTRNKMVGVYYLASLAVTAFGFSPDAQAQDTSIIPILTPGFNITGFGVSDMTSDGSILVGTFEVPGDNGPRAYSFKWSADEGLVTLGLPSGNLPFGVPTAISADGAVIAGIVFTLEGTYPGIWNGRSWQVAPWAQQLSSSGRGWQISGISDDGTTFVGGSDLSGIYPNLTQNSFRYSEKDGLSLMGDLPGGAVFSTASGISGDGKVVVGSSVSQDAPCCGAGSEATLWTEENGLIGLGRLQLGSTLAAAFAASFDGSVIVGASSGGDTQADWDAFLWSSSEGKMIGLGTLGGRVATFAGDVNADGSIVVGYSGSSAFIWDEGNGMRSLAQLLNATGADLSGWSQLSSAHVISADGLRIAGSGIYNGKPTGFYAVVPEPNAATVLGAFCVGLLCMRRSRSHRSLR